MQMMLQQRVFSWLDSYDIYDETGNVLFSVNGKLSLGHKLEVTDGYGNRTGLLKEEIFRFLPQFSIYDGQGGYIGKIIKKLTLFRPSYELDCNGWKITGSISGWNYAVNDVYGREVLHVEKKLFQFSDTYMIYVADPMDAFLSLMIVLAIDAANCS